MYRIGFGGGCHWCTEAIFQSLIGVEKVEQGWISSILPDDAFSEAVIVYYNDEIPLDILIETHLLTHNSMSNHSLREKYRSAIYYFEPEVESRVVSVMEKLSALTSDSYVTKILPFVEFRQNEEQFLNYYQTDKERPFCKAYIHPKLALIRSRFARNMREDF